MTIALPPTWTRRRIQNETVEFMEPLVAVSFSVCLGLHRTSWQWVLRQTMYAERRESNCKEMSMVKKMYIWNGHQVARSCLTLHLLFDESTSTHGALRLLDQPALDAFEVIAVLARLEGANETLGRKLIEANGTFIGIGAFRVA